VAQLYTLGFMTSNPTALFFVGFVCVLIGGYHLVYAIHPTGKPPRWGRCGLGPVMSRSWAALIGSLILIMGVVFVVRGFLNL
jgi:predicted small integral membrane protein